MDAEMIRLAIQEKIPLYGFCRGMQSILSYFGNDLTDVEGHVAVRHYVKTENRKRQTYRQQLPQSGMYGIRKAMWAVCYGKSRGWRH